MRSVVVSFVKTVRVLHGVGAIKEADCSKLRLANCGLHLQDG